ncbi:MAG: phytoene desaturase [Planctomycetes bacterium]|nr:phytoene desaturase [Planctomycetota bacterium]
MKKVIVIGGGLGGISAAASLAAEGFQVEVIEKNAHLGGKLNVLEKEGFSFDLGPSILTMPHIFERLFTRAGKRMEDYVEIEELRPHWRNFFEDGTTIDLYPTGRETAEQSERLSREDGEDLERFLAYSRKLYESTLPSYFDRGIDTFWGMMKFHGVLRALFEFDALATVDQGVRRHIKNRYLVDILNYFVKYVGSSPYDAPALMNLLAHVQSEFGLWYVKGGLFNLAKGLARLLGDLGVKTTLQTEVVRLDVKDRRVTAARLADGTAREADIFISNMEVIPACRDLLGESPSSLRRFRRFEPACSGLVLHLGVDREYPHLAHHNFFYARDSKKHFSAVFREKTLSEDPTIYLVAAARTDRSQAPEGCENIKVLPHIPHIQDPPFTREDYLALRERVLDKLERMGLDGLRRHIIVEDMWTPDDIQRMYYSNRGAIYGVVADRRKNFGLKAPKKSDRHDNLYFVGGSVNPGSGMPMAALSGQQVRDRIAARL